MHILCQAPNNVLGLDRLGSSLNTMIISTCRCEPNQPAALSKLAQLGVLYWQLDADAHETDPKLAAIRKVYNYSYMVRDTLPGVVHALQGSFECCAAAAA